MKITYDVKKPARTYQLRNKYREISGICLIPESDSLVFVQDEAVRVYRFDLSCEAVTEYVKHDYGDAEDIVVIDNIAYLLHAGNRPSLYKITDYNHGSAQYERFDLNLDKDYDPEGLCHDVEQNRLLIACKGSPVKGDRLRKIFAFDLHSEKKIKDPVMTIDSRDFLAKKKKRFHPSGIAIHPQSNDIFLIGTKEVKMIICYSPDGAFKAASKLDKKLLPQPEGIAFTQSAELVICSEGVKSTKGKKRKTGKKAKIVFFASEI